MTLRVAACPLVVARGRLRVVLVTGRQYGEWSLPKGREESHLSRRQVAELEAWEEAGVVGKAVGTPSRFMLSRRGRIERPIIAFAIHVHKLAVEWPEKHQRQRRLVPVDALAGIDLDPAWLRCISRLATTRADDDAAFRQPSARSRETAEVTVQDERWL
ncbi:hypothetical protein LBMAG53_37570 [Planctomycetota bacterium]|nr:hypothetical protein LBMAG53_37570 [Planctomycetota bacterium]